MTELDIGGLFEEPENFRPKSPQPTNHVYQRKIATDASTKSELKFTLIGKHSLWSHVAWNAGIFLSDYIDCNPKLVRGKCVLELGAGAGLPSMISCIQGAEMVVSTDYPEKVIIDMLDYNLRENCSAEFEAGKIIAAGHLWGSNIPELISFLPKSRQNCGFDVIIMCDLVFNHTQHENMLRSCFECLSEDGIVLCAFSHHRPWLADRDLQILELAVRSPFNFKVDLQPCQKMDVMFKDDPGDEEVRKTVHFYILRKTVAGQSSA